MKKIYSSFFAALAVFSLAACQQQPDSATTTEDATSVVEAKYHVTFDLNGGVGTAPTIEDKKEGETFKLPTTSATKEGFDFGGWNEGEYLYQADTDFTMPARDVRFVAKWDVHIDTHTPEPHFSQESYTYDKLAGEDLELPIDLDGANFYYLEIDDEDVPYAMASYSDTKNCIVVKDEFVLELPIGEHDVTAITDGDEEPARCKLIITNSVITGFDEVTNKTFKSGYQKDVRFDITTNGTTIKSLTYGEQNNVVNSSYYRLEDDKLVVDGNWLSHFYGDTEYTVTLSNNDKYNFTIGSNKIFFTDYDITTIHSDVESNIGHNPLYQYYDNVSIEAAPEGMSGRALKYTPNRESVLYDCNGIYTIKTSQCTYMWYEAPFNTTKNYVFSFDYLTENTTVGNFRFRQEANEWGDDLLLGAENDNIVHHYSRAVKGSDLGNGVILYAYFENGSGNIWVDNFSITEIDEIPTFGEAANYNYTNEDYLISVDMKGILTDGVLVDGVPLGASDFEKTAEGVVIKKEFMEALDTGLHTFEIQTSLGNFSTTFRCVRDVTCELRDVEGVYDTLSGENVKLYGSFGQNVAISSVKQADKTDQSAFAGWDFCVNNTTKDYKDLVTLHTGLENTGYIEISKDLCELLYGTTELVIEFNSGVSKTVSISSNIEMFSNYDDTSMLGYFNGGYSTGSPLNSGMCGSSIIEPKEYEEGNNGLSIRSTEGSAAQCAFTTRLHTHPWDWYQINGDANHIYKVSFKYRLTNFDANTVNFFVMGAAENEAAIGDRYFGNYDQAEYVSGDNYYRVKSFLNADGEFHTFESAYFTYSDVLRMFQINFPSFSASDNKEIIIDDFKVISKNYADPINVTEMNMDNLTDICFNSNDAVTSITIDGNVVPYAFVENTYSISSATLGGLSAGVHTIVINYDGYKVVHTITLVDNSVAELTETSKNVVYGSGVSVKLAGEFSEGLTVKSFKRHSDHDWDNTAGRFNRITSDGSLNVNYITIESDGLVIAPECTDQVYATMEYEVTFNNDKKVTFTLTSNNIFYSNYNETYLCIDSTEGNMPGCQDCKMQTIEEVDGQYVLRYTPSNAVLGHALGADNRICTISLPGRNNWWWSDWDINGLTEGKKLYVEIEYKITGTCDQFQFHYWDASNTAHAVDMKISDTHLSFEIDAMSINAFAIGCTAYGSASAGTYMDIYSFCFGAK